MAPDIPAGLDQLQDLVQRMLELIEWQKVTQPDPARRLPPAFELQDHLSDELKVVYGAFLQTAESLRMLLAVDENSFAQRYLWQQQLAKLEGQVRELRMNERFKSY